MKRLLIVGLVLAAMPAFAQQYTPHPQHPQHQADKPPPNPDTTPAGPNYRPPSAQSELVFRLTPQEASVIAEALLERPAKQVMGILSKMQKQFEEQANKGKPAESGGQ